MGGVDVYIHVFLTSALAGCELWVSSPGRFTSEETEPCTHSIGRWVVPRAGLNDKEKWKFLTLPGLELWLLGRPASSQTLYRLRYRGLFFSCTLLCWLFNCVEHYVSTEWCFPAEQPCCTRGLVTFCVVLTCMEDGTRGYLMLRVPCTASVA
jgi:hypothetical protein